MACNNKPKDKSSKETFEEILNNPRVNSNEVGKRESAKYCQFIDNGKTGFKDLDGNLIIKAIYAIIGKHAEMKLKAQIQDYLISQPPQKRGDIELLHARILELYPDCQLWYFDGKNDKGKIIANPNIGYGLQKIKYTDGNTKDCYKIGISSNTIGISIYIMTIKDKNYLPHTYSKTIGKASVSSYCIKFKKLSDIHLDILEAAIQDGFNREGR